MARSAPFTCARDGLSAEAGATHFTAAPRGGSPLINLREPGEVQAWTERLGCSEQRLRLAVAAVGPELEEVCNHLGTVPLARPLDTLAGNGTAH